MGRSGKLLVTILSRFVALLLAFGLLPSLNAQAYQTAFNEVKFDRATAKHVLHGGPAVDPATGALEMSLPLGPGIGNRGASFHPTFAFRLAPTTNVDSVMGGYNQGQSYVTSKSGLEGDLHPGFYDITTSESHSTGGFRISGGPRSSHYWGNAPANFSPNLTQVLPAFGYAAAGAQGNSLSGNGELIISLAGPNGEGPLTLPTWVGKDENGYTQSQCRSFPRRILVISANGEVAYEFRYANAIYPKSPIWAHNCGATPTALGFAAEGLGGESFGRHGDLGGEQQAAPPGDGNGDGYNYLQKVRYLLVKVTNRFGEEVRIDWNSNGVGWTAKWFRGGADTGVAVSLSLNYFYAAGTGVPMVNSNGGAGAYQAQVQIHYSGLTQGDVVMTGIPSDGKNVTAPAFYNPWGNLLENFQPTNISFQGDGDQLGFTYVQSSPGAVLSSLSTGTRQFTFEWGAYSAPRNVTPGDWRGYKVYTFNDPRTLSQHAGITKVTVADPQEPGSERVTTYQRTVPTLSGYGSGDANNGYLPSWSSTAFHCAVTFPDGSVTLNKYVPPVSGYAGDNSSPVFARLQTLAHLRHQLLEERKYEAGQDWVSDLGQGAENSSAYLVTRNGGGSFASISSFTGNDLWSVRWLGNANGETVYGPSIYPLRKETWHREKLSGGGATVVYTTNQTQPSSWDSNGPGWKTETETIQVNGTTQAITTHEKSFNSDGGLWFIGREGTQTVTCSQDNLEGSDQVLPTTHVTTLTYKSGTRLVETQQASQGNAWKKVGLAYDGYGVINDATLSGGSTGTNDTFSGQVGATYLADSLGFISQITPKTAPFSMGQSQDAAGRPTSQTDPNGVTTSFEWDSAGRLSAIRPPSPEKATTFEYTDLRTVVQRRGDQYTRLHYNGFGELVRVVRLGAGVYSHQLFGFDTSGRRSWQSAWRASEGASSGWSKPGSPDDIITPGTYVQTGVCAKWGPIDPDTGERECLSWKTTYVPGQTVYNATTHWEYDARGRLVKVTDPNGQVTVTTYSGLSKTVTVAPGTSVAQSTIFDTDAKGRLYRVTDALNQAADYRYDTSGRLTRVTQNDPQTGQSQIRAWTYDGLGRLTAISQPESGITTYRNLDVNGKPWQTDYAGRVVNSVFDALGRVKSISAADGSVNQTFLYGDEGGASGHGLANNKLVQANGNGAQRSLYYEGMNGRLSKLVRNVDGLEFPQTLNYDAYGTLTKRSYPSGRSVSLGVDDARGVPINAYGNFQGSSTLLADLRYDDTTWNLKNLYFGNGASSSFGYDKDQTRLAGMSHATPHASMSNWSWAYHYDPAGRLDSDGEDSYTYDKLNRLTWAEVKAPSGDVSQSMVQSFQYDAFGNRMDTQSGFKNGAVLPSFSQAISATFARGNGAFARNQLPTATTGGASTGVMYDAQGNLTQVFAKVGDANSQVGMTYDALGRVTTVSSPTGTEDYLHDDEGLRIRVYERATGRTRYNIYNEARQLVSQYVAGPLETGEPATSVNATTTPQGSSATTYSGQKAARTWHKNGTNSSMSHWLGSFEGGDTVTATVWFKAPAGVWGQIFLGDAGGNDPYDNCVVQDLQGNGDWQKLTVSRTLTHSDQMWVYIYGSRDYSNSDSVSVIYDDVNVVSARQGMVFQDGFENGLDAWGGSGQRNDLLTASSATTYSGQKAARTWHKNGTNSSMSRWLGSFEGGDTVTATVWFKAPAGVWGQIFLGDAGGNDPYDNCVVQDLQGNGDWQKLTVSRTLTHSDQMWVYIYGSRDYSNSDSVSVIYDDVNVVSARQGMVFQDGFENGLDAWGGSGQQNDLMTSAPPRWKRDIAYVGTKEVAEFTGDSLQVTMCDHLGTPRFVWDGVNAVQRQKFLPFGERHPASAPGTSGKGFTNHEQTDASGLIYMQARMYLPWAGRFASPDPARDQHFEETQSWNIYSYCESNPVMNFDPNGMAKLPAHVSNKYITFLKLHEGSQKNAEGKHVAYNDKKGFATQGYGHLLHGRSGVTKDDLAVTWTESKAEEQLREDVLVAEDIIDSIINVDLSENQYDALVDLAFNYGNGPSGKKALSLIYALVNAKKDEEAAQAIEKLKANPDRRKDDAKIYRSADYRRTADERARLKAEERAKRRAEKKAEKEKANAAKKAGKPKIERGSV